MVSNNWSFHKHYPRKCAEHPEHHEDTDRNAHLQDHNFLMPVYPVKYTQEIVKILKHTAKKNYNLGDMLYASVEKGVSDNSDDVGDQIEDPLICGTCNSDFSNLLEESCSRSQCMDCAFPVVPDIFKDIPMDDEGEIEENTLAKVRRIHNNLGHPSNRVLLQIFKEAKAPKTIIDLVENFHCPICERMKKISPSRPANPARARELGEILAIDMSYHTPKRLQQGRVELPRPREVHASYVLPKIHRKQQEQKGSGKLSVRGHRLRDAFWKR